MAARKAKKNKNSATTKLVTLFLLIFLCAVGINFFNQMQVYQDLEEQKALVLEQIEEERKRGIELSQQREYYTSDAFIEKMAREQLGLMKPDERVFINRAQ